MLGHLFYIAMLGALMLSVPSVAPGEVRTVLVTIGVIGLWRYGWALTHLFRSVWYRKVAFPPMKRKAAEAIRREGLGHAFLLITSFRIDEPTTTKAYAGAFRAAAELSGAQNVSVRVSTHDAERVVYDLSWT